MAILQCDDIPKDMLMVADKLIGVYRALDAIPNRAGLKFRTYVHDYLVPSKDLLQITLEQGYEQIVLRGVRENHALNGLIRCAQLGTQLVWNGQEIYPMAVGYITPANENNPEDQIIIVIATLEV